MIEKFIKRYKEDAKFGQFVRFCINGCLAVAIQYIVYLLLLQVSVPANIAFVVGYIVSFCCNFVITSYWTFHSRPSWKRLTGFGGSHIVNYFVQAGFLNIYIWLGIDERLAGLIAMCSAVPVNFALLRLVYKAPSRPPRGEESLDSI